MRIRFLTCCPWQVCRVKQAGRPPSSPPIYWGQRASYRTSSASRTQTGMSLDSFKERADNGGRSVAYLSTSSNYRELRTYGRPINRLSRRKTPGRSVDVQALPASQAKNTGTLLVDREGLEGWHRRCQQQRGGSARFHWGRGAGVLPKEVQADLTGPSLEYRINTGLPESRESSTGLGRNLLEIPKPNAGERDGGHCPRMLAGVVGS